MTIRSTQRLRVVSGHVSFFTNVKQVRDGVGDNINFNDAVNSALYQLVKQGTHSIGGTFCGIQLQLDLLGDHGDHSTETTL